VALLQKSVAFLRKVTYKVRQSLSICCPSSQGVSHFDIDISAKESYNLWLFCRKRPMGLQAPYLKVFRTSTSIFPTGWRRCIGCLKLQVSFRKRATTYRAIYQLSLMYPPTFTSRYFALGKPSVFPAKEPHNQWLLCRMRPTKGVGHFVVYKGHFVQTSTSSSKDPQNTYTLDIFSKRALQLVALLRIVTYKLRHPTGLRQPVIVHIHMYIYI